MAKPNEAELRRDYCEGFLSLQKVAEKHGIAKSTLIDTARRNKWVREKNPTKKSDQKETVGKTVGNKKRSDGRTIASTEPAQTAGDAKQSGETIENEGFLKPQHEQFAQNIAQGMPQKEAAICSGYSPARADTQASILLKRPDIRRRIKELRQEAALLVTFNAKDLAELSFKSAKEALQDKKFGQVAPNIKNAAQLTGIDMSANKTEVNVDLAGLSYGKVCIVTPSSCPPEAWTAHMDKLLEGKQTAQQ